jgi:soluble lytic murein transglycosylase-like protein
MRRVRPKQTSTFSRSSVKPHWFCWLACALATSLSPTAIAAPKRIHVGTHVRKLVGATEDEHRQDDRPYHTWVHRAEAAYGVSADLIHAIIRVESRYNPKAVSDAGAKGLMQLMPFTAAECGVRDVFDPVQNIFGGALYLRQLSFYFRGDLVLTLAAYHAGPGAVWDAGGVPTSLRTRAYVRAVVAAYAQELARRHTTTLASAETTP